MEISVTYVFVFLMFFVLGTELNEGIIIRLVYWCCKKYTLY
jgi:hypothetical protein